MGGFNHDKDSPGPFCTTKRHAVAQARAFGWTRKGRSLIWETLSLPWRACVEEAWAAFCAGSFPIGAVVTDANDTILSRGRNRINESKGEGGLAGDPLAHAELNALLALGNGAEPARRHTYILYTTTEPCPLCLGAWYMSSVRTLRFAAREPWAGSTNALHKTPYLSRKPVRVFGPEHADLETILVALHVAFTLGTTWDKTPAFLDAWQSLLPRGVALGRHVAAGGLLRRLQADNADAQAMLAVLGPLAAPD